MSQFMVVQKISLEEILLYYMLSFKGFLLNDHFCPGELVKSRYSRDVDVGTMQLAGDPT